MTVAFLFHTVNGLKRNITQSSNSLMNTIFMIIFTKKTDMHSTCCVFCFCLVAWCYLS